MSRKVGGSGWLASEKGERKLLQGSRWRQLIEVLIESFQ